MLQMKLTAAADMGIGEAAITALLGYAVVFFGLVLLMLVVTALGRVMVARTKAAAAAQPEAAPAPQAVPVPAEEAPGAAGELDLHGVEPRQAALIMAIVAHRLGKPLNQLRFKSIREVKDNEI